MDPLKGFTLRQDPMPSSQILDYGVSSSAARNTLAYKTAKLITTVKSFIVQATKLREVTHTKFSQECSGRRRRRQRSRVDRFSPKNHFF